MLKQVSLRMASKIPLTFDLVLNCVLQRRCLNVIEPEFCNIEPHDFQLDSFVYNLSALFSLHSDCEKVKAIHHGRVHRSAASSIVPSSCSAVVDNWNALLTLWDQENNVLTYSYWIYMVDAINARLRIHFMWKFLIQYFCWRLLCGCQSYTCVFHAS